MSSGKPKVPDGTLGVACRKHLAGRRILVASVCFTTGFFASGLGVYGYRAWSASSSRPSPAGATDPLATAPRVFPTARTERRAGPGKAYTEATKAERPQVQYPSTVDPSAYDALMAEARSLLEAERFPEALEAFRRAGEARPGDPRPHHGQGESYRRLDRAELSSKSFEAALELDPTYMPSRIALARVWCDLGRNAESLGLLASVVKERPNDPVVLLALAKNHLRLGQAADAVAWLERYVAVMPLLGYGHAHLGKALVEAGRPEAAEASLRRALALEPMGAMAHLWLGQLLLSQGKKAEAERELASFRECRDLEDQVSRAERDLLRRPNDVIVLVTLARARFLLGRHKEALIPLEKAMGLKPEDPALRKLHEGVRLEMEKAAASGGRGGDSPAIPDPTKSNAVR